MAGRLLDAKSDEQPVLLAATARLEKEYKDRLEYWANEKVTHKDDQDLFKVSLHC